MDCHRIVVNCFQIIIFVLTRTAYALAQWDMIKLWIAFKSLSLCWQEQQVPSVGGLFVSCELLSNHYLCADKNSLFTVFAVHNTVVNCFQIIIFVLTRTAFNIFSFGIQSCELLSNHYLCADKNSTSAILRPSQRVVNCFQIIIFVLTRTAA